MKETILSILFVGLFSAVSAFAQCGGCGGGEAEECDKGGAEQGEVFNGCGDEGCGGKGKESDEEECDKDKCKDKDKKDGECDKGE